MKMKLKRENIGPSRKSVTILKKENTVCVSGKVHYQFLTGRAGSCYTGIGVFLGLNYMATSKRHYTEL